MPRIAGIDIPIQKKIRISLTYIFGVGRSNVEEVLKQANIDGDKRAKDLDITHVYQGAKNENSDQKNDRRE